MPVDTRQYNRDQRIIRRQPDPPRDLAFDRAKRELTWKAPKDSRNLTHFNIRLNKDDGDPDFQVGGDQTRLYVPNAKSVVISSWNEPGQLQSAPAKLDLPNWEGATGGVTITWRVTYTLTTPTLAINPPTAPIEGERLVLTLIQDATGGRNVTWGANFSDVPRFIVRKPLSIQQYEFIGDSSGKWRLLSHADEYARSQVVRTVTARGSMQANDETIELDSTAAAITLNALGANDCIGRTFTFKRINAGANAITIQMAGSDTVDGAGSLSLATQWQSVTIRSIGAAKYIQVSAAVSSTSTVTPSVPADVTLGTPTYRFGPPDSDGKVLVYVSVPYTPPSPLGTFDRVVIYLQAPDDAAKRAVVSDVSGFVIGPSVDASRIIPSSNPQNKGTVPYKVDELILSFSHPAPSQAETWRIYAVSGSTTVENKLVRADLSGASPSVTLAIDVPPAGPIGAEYVPNALTFSAVVGFPRYSFQDGGDQLWGIAVQWTNAVTDPRFPKLDGYYIVWEYADGRRERAGFVSPFDLRYDSDKWPVPAVAETFTIYLVSAAQGGRLPNSIVKGTTTSITFGIVRQDGTSGREYADLVTLPSAQATYVVNGDGQKQIRIDTSWVNPANDPRYAGCAVGLRIPAEDFVVMLTGTESDSPVISFVEPQEADKACGIFFLSVDTSDRKNTYVYGITPEVPLTLPAIDIDVENVTGFSVTTAYRTNGDGQKVLVVTPNFTPPTDPQWAGISFELEISGDPNIYVLGEPFEGGEAGEATLSDFPQTAESWAFRARSIDVNGQKKAGYVRFPTSGYTTVGPPSLGAVGTEYTGHVTGASAAVTAVTTSSGTVENQIRLMFSPPSGDVTWGGVEARLYDGATLIDKVRSAASPPSVTLIVQNPDSSKTLTWKLVSFDVNGRTNSETAGTPQGTVLVGSTAGTLDWTKFDPLKVDGAEFEVSGGRVRIKGVDLRKAIVGSYNGSEFEVSAGAYRIKELAAEKINTGILSVGGGGGKVSRFAVFNNAGSPVGWIGDDTAVSGYDGAWFKRVLIGGSTPAGAQIVADSSGNVAISGSLIVLGTIGVGKLGTNSVVASNMTAGSISSDKLDAISINVGGGGSKPGKFSVFNASGSQVGFIGVESGFEGGWFKAFRLGGTSASNAKFIADTSGNLSIMDASFSLTLNGVVTEIANISSGFTVGVRVKNQFGNEKVEIGALQILGKDSSGSGSFNIAALGSGATVGYFRSASSGNSVDIDTGTTSSAPYVDVVKNFFTPGVAEYRIDGTSVVRQRRTGWSSPSGVTTRSTFNTATVTVQELAERFYALYVDLSSSLGHGLIN